MPTSNQVRSLVIDVRAANMSPLPRQIVADTNVLYWLFYPNFASLQSSGGNSPSPYQRREYPRFWAKATRAGASFCTSVFNLGELAKVVEHSELEMFWRNDPNPPQFDPNNPSSSFSPQLCKLSRYHYGSQRPAVRQQIEQTLASVKKNVPLMPCFRSSDDEYARAMIEWMSSAGDFGDAVAVAQSKLTLRAPYVLSDDMDLATFDGITLYTANIRIISDAAQNGMLRT
jgi:hypothetical protein